MTPPGNPLLPSWEYVPDAEPRIWGNRLYLFGSHDRFGGTTFCLNDYVAWSTPLDDPGAWRFEGVIYRKTDDPSNPRGKRLLYAPDVVQGPDGRFYLYYAFDFRGVISVAVADTPVGPYRFRGSVRRGAEVLWPRAGDPLAFDPGVLVDEGRVFLYVGFAPPYPVPRVVTGGVKRAFPGGWGMELEADMVTLKTEPRLLFPRVGQARGTGFEGHEFFEASSIRRVGDRYCFVYSSVRSHELCHAFADHPLRPFTYAGTLVSNGDLPGDQDQPARAGKNYTGNTHGSIARVGDRWFVFYHRQTNRHEYSRQAMAEPLVQNLDGSFAQAELTSSGLNVGPLPGLGTHGAATACHLGSSRGPGRYGPWAGRWRYRRHPYFTQDGPDGEGGTRAFIANLRTGAEAGFRYYDTTLGRRLTVVVRGPARGIFEVRSLPDGRVIARVPLAPCTEPTAFSSSEFVPGASSLGFRYIGPGRCDFFSWTLD